MSKSEGGNTLLCKMNDASLGHGQGAKQVGEKKMMSALSYNCLGFLLASGTLSGIPQYHQIHILMHPLFLLGLKPPPFFFPCWLKPHRESEVLSLTFCIFSLIRFIS